MSSPAPLARTVPRYVLLGPLPFLDFPGCLLLSPVTAYPVCLLLLTHSLGVCRGDYSKEVS